MPLATTVSEAWLLTLEHVAACPAGRAVHVITSLDPVGHEIPAVRAVVSCFLERHGSTEEGLEVDRHGCRDDIPILPVSRPGEDMEPCGRSPG